MCRYARRLRPTQDVTGSYAFLCMCRARPAHKKGDNNPANGIFQACKQRGDEADRQVGSPAESDAEIE